MTKKELLQAILKSIYKKTTVSEGYDEKEPTVIFKSGLFDECQFTVRYEERFRKLFKYTFLEDSVKFCNSDTAKRDDCNFDRNQAMVGAISYLQKNISALPQENVSHSIFEMNKDEKNDVCKIIYDIFCDYYLPFIFTTDTDADEDEIAWFEEQIVYLQKGSKSEDRKLDKIY